LNREGAMTPVVIKSTQRSRSLVFSDRKDDCFNVELTGDGVSASKRIWSYDDTSHLIELFDSIAKSWKGWDGVKSWEAIEGDLSIEASSDGLGHIRLQVILRNHNPEDNWKVDAPLFLDAGSLEQVAHEVRRFFSAK
jgi:hypothetical protein